VKLPELGEAELIALSLGLEKRFGYDSIPTVERMYGDDSGKLWCVFPLCKYSVRDPVKMWRHVHGFTQREYHRPTVTSREIDSTLDWNSRNFPPAR